MEGLGGVVIAVLPYVIHPKTAVLGRAVGGLTNVAQVDESLEAHGVTLAVRSQQRP